MWLQDVSPRLSRTNVVERPSVDPELTHHRDTSNTLGVQGSNAADVVLGEFRVGMIRSTSRIQRAPHIELMGHILQIIEMIILRIPVFVIDVVLGWSWAEKGARNKFVHIHALRPSLNRHADRWIALVVHRAQHAAVNAADTTASAHFIRRAVNMAPSFRGLQ